MTREQWIEQCADRFRSAGLLAFSAKDCAITEFLLRCQDEPIDGAPLLPPDRWPAPEEAADDVMREWGAAE